MATQKSRGEDRFIDLSLCARDAPKEVRLPKDATFGEIEIKNHSDSYEDTVRVAKRARASCEMDYKQSFGVFAISINCNSYCSV